MTIAKDRPWRRISSGSSAAATSVVRVTPSGVRRVTGTARVGARLAGGSTRSSTAIPPVHTIVFRGAPQKRVHRGGVREAALVFDRQIGKALAERGREEPHAGWRRRVVHAAARRLRLQHEAGKTGAGQL